MTELNAAQVLIIGFIATFVAQAISIYLSRKSGIKIGRKWITVSLYVVAVILAYFWAKPLLPAFPVLPVLVDDPAICANAIISFLGLLIVWLGQLVAALSSIVGFATLIYNTLLKQVFEKLGWTATPESQTIA
jgi:hypothetical protein